MNKSFSIVIPIFNESNSIINLLDEINSYLKEEIIKYEVIIVDDSSSDNSVSIINEYIIKYEDSFNLKLIVNKRNEGQSFSIREGIKSSIHDIIVTIDGDGQNNPKDIMKLINFYNMIMPATVGDQWSFGLSELGSASLFAGLFLYVVFSALAKALACSSSRLRASSFAFSSASFCVWLSSRNFIAALKSPE